MRVDVSQLDGQMSIAVSDTGTGIPEAALKTIFEEFQQVKGSDQKEKGTGLGLAITRRFSEFLGGTIDVESEIGKGSYRKRSGGLQRRLTFVLH
ncbi:MAG: ATP-binding protein, partial [bacterium]|nr:ATP-binding protein [bacterium]